VWVSPVSISANETLPSAVSAAEPFGIWTETWSTYRLVALTPVKLRAVAEADASPTTSKLYSVKTPGKLLSVRIGRAVPRAR
jgi:hypothetical protein